MTNERDGQHERGHVESPELIDFDAAGALLGFSGRTVRRMVARGTFVRAVAIPGVRGKRLRRQEVLDWVSEILKNRPNASDRARVSPVQAESTPQSTAT